MKGKLIVIEGTDCSGKATQSRKVVERLNNEGIRAEYLSFPMYDTPPGQIVGANILGKPALGECTFPEGTTNIPPKIAALYYAADRAYNVNKITEKIDAGINVILDRYVESNMAHQGAKLATEKEKIEMLLWLEHLEYSLLELPKPDKVIFLHVPFNVSRNLRACRIEELDNAEKDENHLINAEKTYFLLKERYKFDLISCTENDKIRLIDDIHEEVYALIKTYL